MLSNGLLLITEQLPHVHSVCLGLAFRIGSRDDPKDLVGLCHLNEHMVFKGTDRLSARDISYAAESLGAELNAFTDKETTCFYGRFPSDQQVPVTELLCDIVARPAFNQLELEKEKGVIAEEIRSADEDPDSKTFNLTFQAFYQNHPMGWPISGTLDSLARAEPEFLRRVYAERYHVGTGLAVAVGEVRTDELAQCIERTLGHWPRFAPPVRTRPVPAPAGEMVETRRDLSQVYICLAVPAFPFADLRRHALAIFNTAFGGGLSSRLFQRLRETEGLVYSVSSFAELFEDSGFIGVYFVAEASKLTRCLEVITDELERLRRHRFGSDEIERALIMTRSSILLALESPTSRMLRLARSQQLLGQVQPLDEALACLDRVKHAEINDLADQLFSAPGFCVGAVGPIEPVELRRLLPR
ncbi:MAG: pitrilysin family protein [candidate division WOR-3 bacterium]